MEAHFQFYYKGIERHGRETTTQLFLLNNSASLYLSGRLIFKSYENYINDTFNCIALLQDPYTELAERLLTLKYMGDFGKELLGERDLMAFGPAIAFAKTIENDDKVLHRAFSTMPRAVIANLANPLTRELAARTADEIPIKGAVATALATLSSFAVLGIRERQDLFLAQLADLIGIPAETLPRIPDFFGTSEYFCTTQRGARGRTLDRARPRSLPSRHEQRSNGPWPSESSERSQVFLFYPGKEGLLSLGAR